MTLPEKMKNFSVRPFLRKLSSSSYDSFSNHITLRIIMTNGVFSLYQMSFQWKTLFIISMEDSARHLQRPGLAFGIVITKS